MDFGVRDAVRCALASEPTRFLSGSDESLSVLTEQALACVHLAPAIKIAGLCLNCGTRASRVMRITLFETRPETYWIAYQHVEKPYQIYVATFMGAAGNTPDSNGIRDCINDPTPFSKNAPRPPLQTRILTNNLLVSAEDVAIKQETNNLFPNIT
jgi:hypothetical protein